MYLTPDQLSAAAAFGVDPVLLPLAMQLIEQSSDFPHLDSQGRVTVYLDTRDWIGLSRARLGQPAGRRTRTCTRA